MNQLVSALERKMGKIKRFPLILKLVLFIEVYKNINALYLEAFIHVVYVIKDCLAWISVRGASACYIFFKANDPSPISVWKMRKFKNCFLSLCQVIYMFSKVRFLYILVLWTIFNIASELISSCWETRDFLPPFIMRWKQLLIC